MPYIITTRNAVRSPRFVGDHGGNGQSTRRAVATLEEAREYVLDYCEGRVPTYTVKISDSGGTIGPLPDGTVIEVEKVHWAELADRADRFPVPWSHERILDAFNGAVSA